MTDAIERVRLAVPQDQLDDLARRLAAVRWPAGRTVTDTSQGPVQEKLEALVAHWSTAYDWRRVEAELDGWGLYRTTIDGLDIDFVHVRSPEPDALALVLTHGWPGSVLEFRRMIGPLTDPAAHGGDPRQAFHVVLPVLPGFGFSAKPAETGWDVPRIARAWVVLVERLGYARWGAQGGDFGAAVTDELARLAPPGLVGTHLNFAGFSPTPDEFADATPAEQEGFASTMDFYEQHTGYWKEQATRPQTIGYSLADSPVGLAAWIYTMFQDLCGTPGDAEASFDLDEVLDDIMLYWLPNSGASSARLYWEMAQSGWSPAVSVEHPQQLPVGITMPPHERTRRSLRQLEKRYSRIVFHDEPAVGGHFFAMEQPALLVEDLRSTFAGLREA